MYTKCNLTFMHIVRVTVRTSSAFVADLDGFINRTARYIPNQWVYISSEQRCLLSLTTYRKKTSFACFTQYHTFFLFHFFMWIYILNMFAFFPEAPFFFLPFVLPFFSSFSPVLWRSCSQSKRIFPFSFQNGMEWVWRWLPNRRRKKKWKWYNRRSPSNTPIFDRVCSSFFLLLFFAFESTWWWLPTWVSLWTV